MPRPPKTKKKKSVFICQNCGHTWSPRKKKSKICPNCKTKYWNIAQADRPPETLRGKPKIEISKEVFERLCAIQCTKQEVCEFLAVGGDTLNRWVKETYGGQTFKEVFEVKRMSGKVSLRRTLFKLAATTPSVAIFLAKNWLGMADKQDVDLSGTVTVVGTGYPGAK